MDEQIQDLIEQLSDSQFSARKVAAKKLERLGLQAAPALRQVLQSANPITVTRAIQLLGTIGDREAIPDLREQLRSRNVDIAEAAHTAMAQLARTQKSAEARDRILEELRLARRSASPRPIPVTQTSPVTDQVQTPPRIPAFNTLEQAQRRIALTLPDTVDGLVATLGHKDYQKRSAATNALVERGKDAVIPLCRAVVNRSPVVRQRAAEALGRIQDMASLTVLLDQMHCEMENGNPEITVMTALRDAILPMVSGQMVRPLFTMEAIAIVRLVSWQAAAGLPYSLFVMAANQLKENAAESPDAELRSALPYLKGKWPFVPREFATARKAIEEATRAWADLPIASVEPASKTQDLPVPAAEVPVEVSPASLPRPTGSSKPAKLAPIPKDLDGLIEALTSPDEEWRRRIEGALLVRGSEAVLPLRWAFMRAKTGVHQARIAGVLTGIGDIEALVTLWVSWRAGQEAEAKVSLKAALLRMGAQLPVLFQKNTLDDLLYLLTESRSNLPQLAGYVAQALERRAKECPTPELRQALPALRESWRFESARVAIEKATAAWADLPIASSGPTVDAHDLPRPTPHTIVSSTASLPRPSKEQV